MREKKHHKRKDARSRLVRQRVYRLLGRIMQDTYGMYPQHIDPDDVTAIIKAVSKPVSK